MGHAREIEAERWKILKIVNKTNTGAAYKPEQRWMFFINTITWLLEGIQDLNSHEEWVATRKEIEQASDSLIKD